MTRPLLHPCLRLLFCLSLLAPGLPVRASSPEAWAGYGRTVLRSCTAASGLRQPRPAGERVDVQQPSGDLVSVLLLEGAYPQPHMAGRRGLELCLFDSRSRRASVAEADRLLRPARP